MVYPIKYTQFCHALFCCGYILTHLALEDAAVILRLIFKTDIKNVVH